MPSPSRSPRGAGGTSLLDGAAFAGPTDLAFVLEGDGTADAFFLGAPPATTTTTPEPSAAALLAVAPGAGLAVRRRGRRRRS